MNPLKDIFRLIFPSQCVICRTPLGHGVTDICLTCRLELPLTYFWKKADNPVALKFWGHIPIETGSAYFYYMNSGRWKSIIHSFKYRKGWRYAQILGEWYGAELRESGNYNDIDVIIPIPLHPLKKIKRGYNQCDWIAKGIGKELGVEVDYHSVSRRKNNISQTQLSHTDRWGNVDDIFTVKSPKSLEGKHILLIDDVLTTGATIVSCGSSISKRVSDCKFSVAILGLAGEYHALPPKNLGDNKEQKKETEVSIED